VALSYSCLTIFAASLVAPMKKKVTYYNCGDWVESRTALVEGEDGIVAMVNHNSFPARRSAKFEINPKQIRITKSQNFKQRFRGPVCFRRLKIWDFVFVSDFGFAYFHHSSFDQAPVFGRCHWIVTSF
jgi:hypothetical protein